MQTSSKSGIDGMLSKFWSDLVTEKPARAVEVTALVDGGTSHPQQYYLAYNRALVRAAVLAPSLMDVNSDEGKLYLLMLAYTEHRMKQ